MPEESGDRQQFRLKRIDPQGNDSIIRSNGKFMKFNKNVVISVIIILITLIVGGFLLITKKDSLFFKSNSVDMVNNVGLKFRDKNYELKFSDIDPQTVMVISDFEKENVWQGNHEFDDIYFWEREYSLLLSSRDNELIDVFTEKNMNLDNYKDIKFALNVKTDPAEIESIRIYFADKNKNSLYYYSIRSLVKGWNFLTIPKDKFSSRNVNYSVEASSPGAKIGNLNWDNIERVGFEFASRANSTSEINVDSLKAFRSEEYADDWLVKSPVQLDLTKIGSQYYLEGRNFGGTVALIKKLSGINSFKFQAKLIPMKNSARSGLFVRGDYKTGYGYYFVIDGINGNRYQIFKIGLKDDKITTTTLKNGVINNFIVEKDTPLWLKVEAKGSNFKYFLSTDDRSYSELASVNDSEFKEGGVGIVVSDLGATLFDEFQFSQ